MAKDNLISLAKGKGLPATARPTNPADKKAVQKKVVPKVVEKPKTKEEVRDEKAKETVEKLLQNVELVPKVEAEPVVEETNIVVTGRDGIEWLEEQITLLNEQNELLKAELGIAKEDYAKLFEKMQSGGNTNASETILQNVLFFFNEMQANYLGLNPQGVRFTVAYPERLLLKLIQLFPFLENYRKF